MRRMLLATFIVIAPAVVPAGAQTLEDADSLLQAGDWPGAAAAYEAILAWDSTVAMASYRLARVRGEQGRHREAVELYDAAERHGFGGIHVRLGKARAYVALGEERSAL